MSANVYARTESGEIAEYPLTEADIKQRFSNTSFCIPFEPPVGYEVVGENPSRPTPSHQQNLVELEPAWVGGALVRQYRLDSASNEQIAERTAIQASLLRSDRNDRLAMSDWTQLPDSPVNRGLWATYRQDLRDVPNQEGFPWEVQWPIAPG